MSLMDKAWELFDKAVAFEAKANDTTKGENVRRIAGRACDRKLNDAVAAEAIALAAGETHGD